MMNASHDANISLKAIRCMKRKPSFLKNLIRNARKKLKENKSNFAE